MNPTATAHTFFETTCAAEFPGCTGEPTVFAFGDEYCAHCAAERHAVAVEEAECAVEEAEEELRATQRKLEDLVGGVRAARAKLASLKGEPAPARAATLRLDPESVLRLLDGPLTDYTKGETWLEERAATKGMDRYAYEAGGRKTIGDGLFKSVQWVRDYIVATTK